MLHRFSQFLVACTVILILAGSLVTSHDAGLSVPDWPTSYGWNMFTFPPSMWVANILYARTHTRCTFTTAPFHHPPSAVDHRLEVMPSIAIRRPFLSLPSTLLRSAAR
jgi:hypothetical protein